MYNRPAASCYQIWIFSHLPLVIGLIATGVGVGRVVGSEPADALDGADRWLICVAVAISLCCLGLLQYARATARRSLGSRVVSLSYLPGAALLAVIIALVGGGLLPLTVISLLAGVCFVGVLVDIVEDVREGRTA